MDRNSARSGRKASQRAREKLRKAECGDLESAEALDRTDVVPDGATVSAEQEASDGPEGRGLPR